MWFPFGWTWPLALGERGRWAGGIHGPHAVGLLLAGRATRSTPDPGVGVPEGKGVPWVTPSLTPGLAGCCPLL